MARARAPFSSGTARGGGNGKLFVGVNSAPKHVAAPARDNAQMPPSPALTAATSLPSSGTRRGRSPPPSLLGFCVPQPAPQHQAVPSLFTAHAVLVPHATATASSA